MSEMQDEDERELMLCDDGVSIPMHDMVPAGLLGKILRKTAPSPFAVESRRIARVEAEQIPKRIIKHFSGLQKDVGHLGFEPNFLANIPAIGPIAISMLSMTNPSAESSFFAVRTVVRSDGELVDTGYHGFFSFLAKENLLVTMTKARLPKPRESVDRLMMETDDPKVLSREHRKRMRENAVLPTEPEQVLDHIRQQNCLDVREFLDRGLIRPATPGEISRIRVKAKR